MPAIGRDISRRALLLGLCALPAAAADPAQEVWEVITTLAAALSRSDPGEFLSVCDPAMPNYAVLKSNVVALVAQAEVESGIDPESNAGDDRARDVEADWSLHLVAKNDLQQVTRRRETVKCRIEKRGRKWKVAALDPVALFAPPLP
jgi:hypothetical protein